MILLIVFLEILPLICGEQKCYTNLTNIEAQTCPKELAFCCYELLTRDYYCCEEKQWWTVVKGGAIVFSLFLLFAFLIVTFVLVFVELPTQVSTASIRVQVTSLGRKEALKEDEDSFSVFFDTTLDTDDKEKEKVSYFEKKYQI